MHLDKQGRRRLASEFRPKAYRFAGWSPYFGKRWTLAIEKLRLKEYALKSDVLTPPWWTDPGADVADVVVKQSFGADGMGVRGPFRSSKEAGLDEGEYYERFVRGSVVRAWFWNGAPICCEIAEHGAVRGDGEASIRELIAQRAGKRAKKLNLEPVSEFLAYQGKSLDSAPAPGELQPVDFRHGRGLGFLSETHDLDLRKDSIPGAEGRLEEIGACLMRGIPETLRPNTVFTVDAVLDDERRLWLLSMSSDPFLHPYLYGPMIASWAEDPKSSLERATDAPDEALTALQ